MELSTLNGLEREAIGDYNCVSITIGDKRFDLSLEENELRIYKISKSGQDSICVSPHAANVIIVR